MTHRMLVGTRKGLFRFERKAQGQWHIGKFWFAGDPVSMLLSQDLGAGRTRIHAALDLGHFGVKFQRSDDDGASWAEAPAPTYPKKPEDMDDRDPMRGVDIPWTTKLAWSLERGTDDELWCGTIPGALFHSLDAGDHWQLVDSLWHEPRRKQWMGGGYDFAGIHSIMVDPRDPQHITVGVSVGGVWTSPDKGASWSLIGEGLRNEYMPPGEQGNPLTQDAHRIVHCPSQADRLWMQHHNGIFRSDDGGLNWQELQVSPSSFGFAVVVHPNDPDTAWFVPARKDEQRIPVDARLVVTRTRDGGHSFDVLDEGLPSEPAYDLIYRHGMDISKTGDCLAFGSTTGSLWVSENQGDSWQCLSRHLPPINCLRFE